MVNSSDVDDVIFSPLRKQLDRNLRKYMIGQTLGTCPRTGDMIDIRTAVFVLDPKGDPYMAMSQRGWAEVVKSGVVPSLANEGYRVDLATVKDVELREKTSLLDGSHKPTTPTNPDQMTLDIPTILEA